MMQASGLAWEETRMDLGLRDQIVIVTGGSRGIGLAAATAFLREGARVMISSVHPASVEAALKELQALGTVEGLACDVAREEDVVHLVSETIRRFGRLDVMVANAGIGGDEVNLVDMTTEQWDQVMDVNLRGVFLCGREAARAMRSSGCRGRIVTVGSIYGLVSSATEGHYCTSKTAIHGLTRSMAVDFARWGVRVNCVAPGWVRTGTAAEYIPPPGQPLENCGVMNREAEPEEIGNAIAFLASDACGFTTGETFVIDGGQTILASAAENSASGS